MTKVCAKCLSAKPPEAFYPDPSKSSRLSSYCRDCQIERSRARWETKNAEVRAANKAYYQQHREQFLAYGRALRLRVIAEYGGRCTCCGETTAEFLGIDHVDNDGESHRRELKGYGRSIYRWLKRHGFPKEKFQLLCHNCNMAKGLYGGCPHQGPPPGRRQKTTRWRAAH